MIRPIAISMVALAYAFTATPSVAQSSADRQKAKVKASQQTTPAKGAYARGGSPSGNPEWDVYVNGDYVGSDPDPRIRSTIREQAKGSHSIR